MILFRARMSLGPSQRARVAQSLAGILGPTRAMPGCVSCQLAADVDEESDLLLIEEWDNEKHLEARLRDDSLRVVMAAMDCAVAPPQVRFDTIRATKGMELVAACRSSADQRGAREHE